MNSMDSCDYLSSMFSLKISYPLFIPLYFFCQRNVKLDIELERVEVAETTLVEAWNCQSLFLISIDSFLVSCTKSLFWSFYIFIFPGFVWSFVRDS